MYVWPPRVTQGFALRRWGIDEGGEIGFIDLGEAALVVPGGVAVARQELRRVLKDRYETGLASIADPMWPISGPDDWRQRTLSSLTTGS